MPYNRTPLDGFAAVFYLRRLRHLCVQYGYETYHKVTSSCMCILVYDREGILQLARSPTKDELVSSLQFPSS